MSFLIKFKSYIAGIATVFAGLVIAYISGKSRAEHSADMAEKDREIEQAKAESKEQVVSATTAKNTVNSVNGSSNSTVDSELQQFTRD